MITNQWKHILSLIPAHEELSKFTISRMKRKRAFFINPFSLELTRAKIGNFRDMQACCLKNVAFQEKSEKLRNKLAKSCGINQQKVAE